MITLTLSDDDLVVLLACLLHGQPGHVDLKASRALYDRLAAVLAERDRSA